MKCFDGSRSGRNAALNFFPARRNDASRNREQPVAARRNIGGFALRALCALALLFVSFAHQVPAFAASAPEAFSAAYMLPDGTFPDLCLSGDVHDPDGEGAFKPGCEACRLSASVLLPQPPVDCARIAHSSPAAFSPLRLAGLTFPVFSPNAPPRGPPSSNLTA